MLCSTLNRCCQVVSPTVLAKLITVRSLGVAKTVMEKTAKATRMFVFLHVCSRSQLPHHGYIDKAIHAVTVPLKRTPPLNLKVVLALVRHVSVVVGVLVVVAALLSRCCCCSGCQFVKPRPRFAGRGLVKTRRVRTSLLAAGDSKPGPPSVWAPASLLQTKSVLNKVAFQRQPQ